MPAPAAPARSSSTATAAWPDHEGRVIAGAPALHVVAALIEDERGRVLMAERPPGKHHAGLWEFPGGKVEPGEAPIDALRRELHEELGIDAGDGVRVMTVVERRENFDLHLQAWRVLGHRGTPRPLESAALRWHAPSELDAVAMPPADRPIARCLQCPPVYAITPDIARESVAALRERLHRMLAAGRRLIRLRCADPSIRLPPSLLRTLADDAAKTGARVVVDLADRLDDGLPHGIHLRAADLHRLDHRPVAAERLLLASCHDAADLTRAEHLGVDAVLISPIRATTSHPDSAAIGWQGFRDLLDTTRLPAYALGGLTAADVDEARRCGAIGIAGIGSFVPAGAAGSAPRT